MWILLCEDYESDELLRTDVREALISKLVPQVDHKVKDRLTAQHLVALVDTQHDGRLVPQDGGAVAWPDGQPRIAGTGAKCVIPNLIKQLFAVISDCPTNEFRKVNCYSF